MYSLKRSRIPAPSARERLVRGLVLEGMPRLDVADGAALRAHHHGVGLRPTLEEADSAQEIAGSDAGGCEDHVPPRHLAHLEDVIHVLDPHLLRLLDLLLVATRQRALSPGAHTAHA